MAYYDYSRVLKQSVVTTKVDQCASLSKFACSCHNTPRNLYRSPKGIYVHSVETNYKSAKEIRLLCVRGLVRRRRTAVTWFVVLLYALWILSAEVGTSSNPSSTRISSKIHSAPLVYSLTFFQHWRSMLDQYLSTLYQAHIRVSLASRNTSYDLIKHYYLGENWNHSKCS